MDGVKFCSKVRRLNMDPPLPPKASAEIRVVMHVPVVYWVENHEPWNHSQELTSQEMQTSQFWS